jgi:hypothetical protein
MKASAILDTIGNTPHVRLGTFPLGSYQGCVSRRRDQRYAAPRSRSASG